MPASLLILLLGFFLPTYSQKYYTPQLQLAQQWKELEFEFPSLKDRTYAINNGLYVTGNAVPIDIDIDYRENGTCRQFVTIPRFATGIPTTLATVVEGEQGPVLRPYPDYSWHSTHGMDCDGITSVFRVFIDECRRIWVLDTGRIGTVQFCPPQLLIFDLRNDNLLHRYRFPQSQYKTGVSLFVTPIVDIRDPPPRGTCQSAKVYIADVTGYGLIVYDALKDTSWRIENKLFYAYPDYGTFTIAGESFDLMDGILGMSITPRNFVGERYLYFHALASGTENAVPLRVIDEQTIWEANAEAMPRAFMQIGTRNIQSAAEVIDSKGNQFFGIMDPIALVTWNINRPYRPQNLMIVAQNSQTLQFASGIKAIKNRSGQEELWVLTNRFQKIMAGTKDSNEINFRIQACFIDDLLNNRPCRPLNCYSGTSSSRNGNNKSTGSGNFSDSSSRSGYTNHKPRYSTNSYVGNNSENYIFT